jgi:hypothetical protein
MRESHHIAQQNLRKFKEKQQERVPEKNIVAFQVNDLVLVQNKHRKHKLDALWEGPYEIKDVQIPNLVVQRVGKRKKCTISVNLVKPFCSQERQNETIRLWIVGISLFLCCECLKPELVEVITSETGIYFDEVGQISFYPMTWKVVSRKRGVPDFVGEISKILFGTLTQADAREYNSHINQLEREQQGFLHISSEQMAVNSVNLTMRRINQNEKVLKDSLVKLNTKVTNVTLELQQEIEQVTMANMQMKTIERGLMECQYGYKILVDALIHSEQEHFNCNS